MLMFASTLCHVDYKEVVCFSEEEKGFTLIFEIFCIFGSGVWLFLFYLVTEIEARQSMNMELDPDILQLWFGPTVRSKLPPGASYLKLIYFLFS